MTESGKDHDTKIERITIGITEQRPMVDFVCKKIEILLTKWTNSWPVTIFIVANKLHILGNWFTKHQQKQNGLNQTKTGNSMFSCCNMRRGGGTNAIYIIRVSICPSIDWAS